jgi:broad specificity phosphatase PhoE
MLEIILTRHGETDWNLNEIFRGTVDVPLNETGLKQADLLGEYLKDTKIDAVYSGPLQRAVKTAEAIASRQALGVEIAPGLTDFNYGDWQGISHREVKETYREIYSDWLNNPERVTMPNGESLDNVRERSLAVVEDMIGKHNEGRIVLASHRVVNKVLVCALLGLDNSCFWNIKLDTCGITGFSYENGRYILNFHNDTSFLKSLNKTPLNDF